ncbi:MAG: hypothetical protein WBC24_05055 [Methylovirgula sp.]
MSSSRDDALRAFLPPKTAEYSFENLSEAETAALEAAFSDGFGNVGAKGYRSAPPPSGISSGLLRHSFYVRADSEYGHEDYPDEFWDWNDDHPPPSDLLPLHFVLRRLRLYFANQLDRFCEHTIEQHPECASLERWMLEERAASFLYQKPWYEFHAVQLMDWIERDFGRNKASPFVILLISSFSGELGRLVEQYYWRFRFEKAAITGTGARAGASTGGKIKATLHRDEQSRWQKVAEEIWTERPDLTKTTVATTVKKRLRVAQTAKHVARFIRRP